VTSGSQVYNSAEKSAEKKHPYFPRSEAVIERLNNSRHWILLTPDYRVQVHQDSHCHSPGGNASRR